MRDEILQPQTTLQEAAAEQVLQVVVIVEQLEAQVELD
jgi:hypothetical protein